MHSLAVRSKTRARKIGLLKDTFDSLPQKILVKKVSDEELEEIFFRSTQQNRR